MSKRRRLAKSRAGSKRTGRKTMPAAKRFRRIGGSEFFLARAACVMPVSHRPELALALARRFFEPDILISHDGLFLAVPRGAGKTTFVREELMPVLSEKALVVYADLEGAKTGRAAVERFLSAVCRALQAWTASGKSPALSFDPAKAGRRNGVSLAEAFAEVITKTGMHVVLIVDAVEKLFPSKAGLSLLKNLKAARDWVNLRPDNACATYLHILGVSSSKAAAKAMVSLRSQPFYGADFMDFPLQDNKFPLLKSTAPKDFPATYPERTTNIMRDEYDFSDAVKNPYTAAAKAARDRAADGKNQKQKTPAGKKTKDAPAKR